MTNDGNNDTITAVTAEVDHSTIVQEVSILKYSKRARYTLRVLIHTVAVLFSSSERSDGDLCPHVTCCNMAMAGYTRRHTRIE